MSLYYFVSELFTKTNCNAKQLLTTQMFQTDFNLKSKLAPTMLTTIHIDRTVIYPSNYEHASRQLLSLHRICAYCNSERKYGCSICRTNQGHQDVCGNSDQVLP